MQNLDRSTWPLQIVTAGEYFMSVVALTWEIALYSRRVKIVSFLETLATAMVECVEVKSSVCGCKGQKGKKGIEELHYACWC